MAQSSVWIGLTDQSSVIQYQYERRALDRRQCRMGHGGSSEYKTHFINHTCSARHVNVEFTHPEEFGKDARVLVRATRGLLAGEEMFVDYGVGFSFEDSVCL